MNGGTALAIAGDSFAVIASDTRLSQGFSIHTRDSPKTYRLSEDTVLACTGFEEGGLMNIVNAQLMRKTQAQTAS